MADPHAVLERSRTVAVVGLSRDPAKAAHRIPQQLQGAGFRIIPVNPHTGELLGEPAYARLADVPEPIDVVEVFRPSAEAPEIARQAVAAGARALWLQQGIASPEAREIAESAGLDYVEDRCMGVEQRRYNITK
ncbi:MAG: CoA-binding domain protein [uncultured Thermomicrobiales bacterium]|uniref:CoA-binding domain protein n=1 Tax=uncultured Thermomicrobiales bacterium TaxID=1645740 RepID=A0A6J4VKZ9_9BACT|nr:MAG: CoA-binding domain protein [uncultured Thermomicrobiales bacterium]